MHTNLILGYPYAVSLSFLSEVEYDFAKGIWLNPCANRKSPYDDSRSGSKTLGPLGDEYVLLSWHIPKRFLQRWQTFLAANH